MTGDMGYLRGEELFWVGRTRERINLHGAKFDPSDFERVLSRVPGLREGCFAAFGVDDEAIGTQRLVLISEVRDSCVTSHAHLTRTIREEIARQLGVTTTEVHLLKQGTMTKTSSGKRRHRFYRQLYLEGGLRPSASIGD
jgi:acyl-CoA synthetase (AMP-forming)/AMP-acid ligase II